MDEGRTSLVHHLCLNLRVEILRDNANNPQDLALPRLKDQAVLLKEVEQVLLGKIKHFRALQGLALRLLDA
ncbi:hypothetical protein D3C73_1408660 [compost metagenome]